ncbi:MAG: RNA methyltransferase [Hyphomicrobiaceae bacterium]
MPADRDKRSSRTGEGSTPRIITSLQNDTVKLIRSLDMRKARRETGLFVAEGASVLITARDNGWRPRMLVTGPDAATATATPDLVRWAAKANADHLEVSAAVLEKLAAKENPQSVMAVFEQRWLEPPHADHLTANADSQKLPPLWIALEDIRDPGNLGTILRTADAAGASGVLLVGNTCDPFSREAVRASMGSVFAIPVARTDLDGLRKIADSWTGAIIGTHLEGATDYRKADWRPPTLLIMGNEGAGLSTTATAMCTSLVRIPMAGKLDSLNLAVATALMLYEIRRNDLPA